MAEPISGDPKSLPKLETNAISNVDVDARGGSTHRNPDMPIQTRVLGGFKALFGLGKSNTPQKPSEN